MYIDILSGKLEAVWSDNSHPVHVRQLRGQLIPRGSSRLAQIVTLCRSYLKLYKMNVRSPSFLIEVLTISVLQAYCAVTTEYGIPSDFVRKSTASLQIKISSAAQFNFLNRNVMIF